MDSASFDKFIAWNDQLAALIAAGVPLDVGLNGDDQATADELGRINTAVARRMSRGDSLSTALTSDEVGAPTKYGCLVRLGLRGGTWNDALDVSYSVADAASESQYTIRSALYYPAIVGCLAFVGFVAFCLFYVPVLDDVHESMQLPAGVGLTLLRAMRDHLAVWVVAVPLGIFVAQPIVSTVNCAPARRPAAQVLRQA